MFLTSFLASAAGPVPFTEIGVILIALAALGRLAAGVGLPALPVPLLVGLLVARGGPLPDGLRPPPAVVEVAASLALVVLLLVLGLEHTRADRVGALRGSAGLGAIDAVVNFVPGAIAGLLLGWSLTAALLLGGATWVSSSGVARWIVGNSGRIGNRETPGVLSVLVLEHVGMVAFLPFAAALVTRDGSGQKVAALLAAAAAVAGAAWAVREHGPAVRRAVFGHADDVLLPLLGTVLVAAGLLTELRVAAAGAYLAGVVLAGPVTATEPARAVLPVLRQGGTAAALFFFAAGLDIGDLSAGPLAVTVLLAGVTTAGKLATGWWAARSLGVGPAGRWRAGATLVARGEFAVALGLVGTSAGVEPDLGPVVAVYVLLTSIGGPLLARRAPAFPAAGRRAGDGFRTAGGPVTR